MSKGSLLGDRLGAHRLCWEMKSERSARSQSPMNGTEPYAQDEDRVKVGIVGMVQSEGSYDNIPDVGSVRLVEYLLCHSLSTWLQNRCSSFLILLVWKQEMMPNSPSVSHPGAGPTPGTYVYNVLPFCKNFIANSSLGWHSLGCRSTLPITVTKYLALTQEDWY